MAYYAVCYGHVCRYEKASSENEAVRLAFGVEFDDRSTVAQLPKSPKYMSHKAKMEFLAPLAVKHYRRTGNVLEGWKDQPGIKNVHHTECWLCRISINTEPAEKGVEYCLCQRCQPKHDTLTDEQKRMLSTSEMRELLNVRAYMRRQ